MAFSEEQEAQILEMMGKMGEFLTKQGESKEEPEKKDEGLLSEAKKNMEKQNNQDEDQAKIEKAVGFNMTISAFADKYKDILPASTKSVIETAMGKIMLQKLPKQMKSAKQSLKLIWKCKQMLTAFPIV